MNIQQLIETFEFRLAQATSDLETSNARTSELGTFNDTEESFRRGHYMGDIHTCIFALKVLRAS